MEGSCCSDGHCSNKVTQSFYMFIGVIFYRAQEKGDIDLAIRYYLVAIEVCCLFSSLDFFYSIMCMILCGVILFTFSDLYLKYCSFVPTLLMHGQT